MQTPHHLVQLLVVTALVWPASCKQTKTSPAPRGSRSAPADTNQEGAPTSELTANLPAPSLGPPPPTHKVGETADARDYSMTVVEVVTCKVEPHFKPQPGFVKLGVQLVIEGRSKSEVPISPLVARLVDSEQNEYSADLAGCTPTLPATRVVSGVQKKGFVSFEIPEGAQGLVMTFSPFVLGMGKEELKFSLGR